MNVVLPDDDGPATARIRTVSFTCAMRSAIRPMRFSWKLRQRSLDAGVPVMPPDAIRTLSFGTAVVLLRAAPPIVTRMRTWTDRPDAARLRADRTAIEALLRRP